MIIWQTGDPPQGVELMIEYEWDSRQFHAVATFNGKCFVDASTGEDMSRIKLLRWSTLDAAPDVVGRLEALLLPNQWPCVEIDRYDDMWHVRAYDDRLGSIAPTGVAPTLAGAIENLCGGDNDV